MAPSQEQQPQTVYEPGDFDDIFNAGRLTEVQQWLTANGIDPSDVPQDTTLVIETIDGQRVLRYDVYLRNEVGSKDVDPNDPDQAAREERTTRLIVEPPTWMSR